MLEKFIRHLKKQFSLKSVKPQQAIRGGENESGPPKKSKAHEGIFSFIVAKIIWILLLLWGMRYFIRLIPYDTQLFQLTISDVFTFLLAVVGILVCPYLIWKSFLGFFPGYEKGVLNIEEHLKELRLLREFENWKKGNPDGIWWGFLAEKLEKEDKVGKKY